MRRTRDGAFALAALGLGILVSAQSAAAQEWIDPGTDSWFDPSNWNPATVPLAGGAVVVSNGGTATLASPPSSTPSLGSLDVGTSALGTGVGTIISNGVTILVGGSAAVGTVSTAGQTATGTVTVTGVGQFLGGGSSSLLVGTGTPAASGQVISAAGTVSAAGGVTGFSSYQVGTLSGAIGAGSSAAGSVVGVGAPAAIGTVSLINVGTLLNTDGAGTATGTLALGGPAALGGANILIGHQFDAAGGSVANGTVSIAGGGGSASFLVVGNVTSLDATQIGSTSTGSLSLLNGANLQLFGGSGFVGTTFGTDRVGGTINTATGTLTVDGTLSTLGSGTFYAGVTTGGVATGTVQAGAIDTSAGPLFGLYVGYSGAQGQATGALAAGDGNVRTLGGAAIGVTAGGTAQGALALGGSGTLIGDGNDALVVGVASGSGGAVVSAAGTVSAAGGVTGFSSYQVGTLSGAIGAGSSAAGSVVGVGAPAAIGTVSLINVGTLLNTDGAGTATGTLALGGPAALGGANILIGHQFDAAGGSVANGTVSIAGGGGSASFLVVGNVTSLDATQIGSTSTGSLSLLNGANLQLFGGSGFVGTTFGTDRVGGTINTATGTLTVDGTLSTLGSGTFYVGVTTGGVATGTVQAGAIDTSAGPLFGLYVGYSGAQGQGTGALVAGGGTLRVTDAVIGFTSGGTATGTLSLHSTALIADNVVAGIGGGVAHLSLVDSNAAIAETFTLLSGDLRLRRSLVQVTQQFMLGTAAELLIDVDGLTRGTEYGAVDAGTAVLAGTLHLDFAAFSTIGGDVVFDIIRSGAIDGIGGDFASFLFTGLFNTFTFVAGVEIEGGVEIYRVRMSVPEPMALALLLPALGLLVMMRRRRPA